MLLLVDDTQPEVDFVGFLEVCKGAISVAAPLYTISIVTYWAPFAERSKMPLPHVPEIRIGRRECRYRTRAWGPDGVDNRYQRSSSKQQYAPSELLTFGFGRRYSAC